MGLFLMLLKPNNVANDLFIHIIQTLILLLFVKNTLQSYVIVRCITVSHTAMIVL